MHDSIPPEALLAGYAPPMQAIAHELRAIIRATLPEAIERVRSGWQLIGYDLPVGRQRRFGVWIWAQPEHVHLGFQRGNLMEDPDHRLEGRGITKLARWLTFEPGDPIDPAIVVPLLHECARITTMSAGERALVAMANEAPAPAP